MNYFYPIQIKDLFQYYILSIKMLKLRKIESLSIFTKSTIQKKNYKKFSNSSKRDIVTSVIRSHQLGKIAMTSYLDSVNTFSTSLNKEEFRKFDAEQRNDYREISDILIKSGASPSLIIPMIRFLFGFGGFVNGFLVDKEFAIKVAYLLERTLEDHTDECLQILNEEDIDAKELRMVIIKYIFLFSS